MSDFDLKGKRIADTYKGLLKLAVSGNGVVSSSLTQVEGGDGTNTALFVATDSVKVGGAFAVSSSVSVGGSLQVTGDVCASSYYGSGRHLTSVVATGDTSVSTLIVANTAEIGGALSVGGGVTLTGAVNLLSTATVSGAAGFLGTVRVSGNTSLGGTLDVAGTATFTNVDVDDINLNGKVFTVTGDTGDTFKITAGANGATTLETVDTAGNAANLTIDADGIIRLDSGSTYGNIQLAHDGTIYGDFHKSGDNIKIRSGISDGDLILSGYDGGVGINALTLDMSNAGAADFNHHVHVGGNLTGDYAATFTGGLTAALATIDYILLDGKVIQITGDTNDTFTITSGANGATTLATTDTAGTSGNITLDADGQIVLDAADNGAVLLKKDGTQYASIFASADNLNIKSTINNEDIVFRGLDDSSDITALTLDMSAAGKAIFNAGATFADDVTVENINLSDKVLTITGDTDDTFTITSGANGSTTLATTDTAGADGFIKLDADGIIVLDAGDASGQTQLKINNTKYGTLFSNGTDFYIKSNVSDGDVIIQGVDGGSAFTALTLDMSAAGKATFNDSISTPALLFLSTDGEKIAFGADTEITIRHVHNSGLQLRNSQTGDVGGFVLTLQSGESEVVTNDVIGTIDFQAYNESSASDSRLVAAGIEAVAEQTFNSTANTTRLKFKTAVSETATEKMTLTGAGNLGIGTTAPDVMLDIQPPSTATNTGIKVRRPNSAAQYIHIHEADGSKHQIEAIGNKEFRISNESASFPTTFYTNSTERMTILADGKVGIGNTSPTSTLHVTGDATVDDINLNGKVLTITGDTNDTFTITSGTHGATTLATTDAAGADGHLTLDVDGNIILDAGGQYGETFFSKNGTNYGWVFDVDTALYIRSLKLNADIHLSGNDGGSYINALILDMSEAGTATFNNDVIVNNTIKLPATTGPLIETTGLLATTDITLLRVSGGGSGGDGQFGFDIKYMGARTGNNNSYSLFMHNTTGTYVEAMTVIQDGKVGIGNTTPTSTLHVTGDATVDDINLNGKVLTITGDTDDTFTITTGAHGATTLKTIDTAQALGVITLDADGRIHLDSGDPYGQVTFMHDATNYATFHKSGNTTHLSTQINDGDLIIRGRNSSGNFFNALTFDMSDTGTATFGKSIMIKDDEHIGSVSDPDAMTISATGKVGIGNTSPTSTLHVTGDATVDDINLNGKVLTITGDTSDTFTITAGANGATTLATTDAASNAATLTLDADGAINLDAGNDYGTVELKRQGSTYGIIYSDGGSGGDLYFRSNHSNAHMNFNGVDGGVGIQALNLDMSAAGKATFNAGAEFKDNVGIGTATPLKKLHVDGPALSTVQTLTDASTVTSDFDTGQNFTLTLAGNRTLGAPSNVDAGQVGSIFIIQDGTGSRTLAYNSIWKFAGGTAPTLSTAAGAIDRLDYIVQSGTAIQAVLTKAYA